MALKPFTGELDAPPTGGLVPFTGELDPTDQPASMMDKALGSFAGRLAVGAASPLTGAAQLGAHVGDTINRATGTEPVVSPWIDKQLGNLKASQQRGMKALGNEGYDWAGLLGSLAPTSLMASGIAKGLPAATSVLGKMGIGATQGGAAAVAQPTEGGEDFWSQKGIQALLGTTLGGAIPAVGEGAKYVGQAVSPIFNLFRGQKGVESLARQGIERGVGTQQIPAVREALLQSKQLVPGSQPTAAEAVAHIPEGSPIAALQKMTAKTEGGPSAAFGERLMKQTGAREIAKTTRDVLTGDLRKEALSLANAGKVEARDVLEGIANIQKQPDLAASDVVSKTLAHLSEKIGTLTDKQGVIDARALYTVRKEMGNTIKTFSKETQNWDKRMTGRIEGDIQKGIDRAINNAIGRAQAAGGAPAVATGAQVGQRAITGPTSAATGPTVWDKYLSEYSQRSQGIADDLARYKLSLRPGQPTSLQRATDSVTQNMPHVALLSRPVVIANALLKHIGQRDVEPMVDALNQRLLLNPNEMGKFLSPQAPSSPQAIIDALMRQGAGAAGTAAGRATN